jgi:hypothetical protein
MQIPKPMQGVFSNIAPGKLASTYDFVYGAFKDSTKDVAADCSSMPRNGSVRIGNEVIKSIGKFHPIVQRNTNNRLFHTDTQRGPRCCHILKQTLWKRRINTSYLCTFAVSYKQYQVWIIHYDGRKHQFLCRKRVVYDGKPPTKPNHPASICGRNSLSHHDMTWMHFSTKHPDSCTSKILSNAQRQ